MGYAFTRPYATYFKGGNYELGNLQVLRGLKIERNAIWLMTSGKIQIKNKNNKHLFCIGILIGGNFIGIELDENTLRLQNKDKRSTNTPEQVTLFDIEERSNTGPNGR